MFEYKNKEGDLVQIIKQNHEKRWFMKIFSAKRKFTENQIFPRQLYSGYGIELIKNKNGIYIPNKMMEIDWYSDVKKDFLFAVNANEIEVEKLIPYLKEIDRYIPPSEKVKEQIDPIND
ncbi:MAG: hypothetical protein NUV46_03980 [Nanoarchaeota archaeon]|nr:hypothetical protein [Nanoarchaeota archaeon]